MDLRTCDNNAKICQFLHMHYGTSLTVDLLGSMMVKKIKMSGKIPQDLYLADKVKFGSPIELKMRIDERGDRIVFQSDLTLQSVGETFKGMSWYRILLKNNMIFHAVAI